MARQESATGVHRESLKGHWRGENPCEQGSAGVGSSSQSRCFPPIHNGGFLFSWMKSVLLSRRTLWSTSNTGPVIPFLHCLYECRRGRENLLYEYAGAACSVWCWLPRTESGELNKDAACKTAECGREGGWKEGKRLEAATNWVASSMAGNVSLSWSITSQQHCWVIITTFFLQ